MKNEKAMKELDLNIKYQNIQVKEFTKIGYEYDKGIYVFLLLFPLNQFPFLNHSIKKKTFIYKK